MDSDLLYEMRHRRRMNQTELARRIGVSQITVSRWERGAQAIPPRMIGELVSALRTEREATREAAPRTRRRRRPLAA